MDALRRIKAITGQRQKVGHAGTMDPLAHFMTFELDESMEDADNLLRIMDHLKVTPTVDEPIGQQSDYSGPLGFSSRSN